MELAASCSTLATAQVDGQPEELAVLGCCRSALYLAAGPSVLPVLSAPAVRLPAAVVLPIASLAALAPDGAVRVGDGGLRWRSGGREIRVRVVRKWLPTRVRRVQPVAARVRELAAVVQAAEIDAGVLLGRGPGLTPSGDDVLAGYLLACRAFGVGVEDVRAEVLRRAPRCTTSLSAALLSQAAHGWCIPQVAALIDALAAPRPTPTVLRALLSVGASSGAALASGLLAAAVPVVRGAAA